MANDVEQLARASPGGDAANASVPQDLSGHEKAFPGDLKASETVVSSEVPPSGELQSPEMQTTKQASADKDHGNNTAEGVSVDAFQTNAGAKSEDQESTPTEACAVGENDSEDDVESIVALADAGGGLVPPATLTEDEILRRMETVLLPDQAGIASFSVRKSNLKRMRLVDASAPEPYNFLPYQHYCKSDVLQEIQKLGKDSDWTEHKTVLRACPLDDILLIRDVKGLYGSNYAWVFTEIAYENTKMHIEELRQKVIREHLRQIAKEERRQERRQRLLERQNAPAMCCFARKWKSETEALTHAQIKQLSLQTRRPLITRVISKDRRFFKQPNKFQPFSDKVHSLRPQKNNVFVPLKKEVDLAVQAVTSLENAEAQTIFCIPKNACTQYDDSEVWVQPTLIEQESKAFSEFFSRVEGLVEEALEQNETTDVFVNSFSRLEKGAFPHFQDSREGLREVLSFNDLNFSKCKVVSCIRWHPREQSVICYTCVENATFDERMERSGRAVQAYLLMWHFEDIITPQAIFSCPADPIVFEMCEVKDEQHVVAGLITGQLCLWKVPALRQLHAGGRGSVETQWSQQQLQSTKPLTVSGIDFSHKRTVSFVSVLPQGTDFRKSTKTAHITSPSATYVVSCSGDDQILVWDITSAVQSSETEDYQWRPILQIPVRRHEAGADVGCCHLIIQKKEATGTATCFWASTEEGEVIRGDWGHAMDDKRTDHVQEIYTETRSCRPTHSFDVSPFYQDTALVVMDLGFHIWSLDTSKPIYSSPTPAVFYSCGTWSSTRPAVFYIGCVDGTLEVWDLSEQSRACSVTFVVAASAVTCLAFPPLPISRQQVCQQGAKQPISGGEERDNEEWLRRKSEASSGLLAVGDASGVVHILSLPKNLTEAVHGEYSMVKTLFAREKDVVSYVTKRRDTLRKERDLECKKRSSNAVEHYDDDQAQPSPTSEEAELAVMEREYRVLETAYKKDLRLAESEKTMGRQENEAQRRGGHERAIAVRLTSAAG